MGTRLEIPNGESYSSGVTVIEGAIPTDEPTAGSIGIFIGNAVLNDPTCTHLVLVAIGQSEASMKEALTNEGAQNLLDAQSVRNPLDPNKQVSNDLAVADETHVWLAYRGTLEDSMKSQLFVGATKTLKNAYREHVGVGS